MTGDGHFLLAFGRDPRSLIPVTIVNFWQLPGVAVGLAFAGDPAQRAELILFRDRVSPDAWRHLAVRLRHTASPGG